MNEDLTAYQVANMLAVSELHLMREVANNRSEKQKMINEEYMQEKHDFVESVQNQKMADKLNEFTELCHTASLNGGWWKGNETLETYGTKIALIHSEISEAMEGLRKDLMDDHLPHRKMLEVELADAMIRIFDLAGKLNLDLGGALVEKVSYNSKRAEHKPENRAKEGGKKF